MTGATLSKPDDLRALTGIRGVAALLVVLFHFTHDLHVFGPLQRLVDHGYLAVDLFFVLSGFVMTLTYGARFNQAVRRTAVVDFLLKRVFRIYPLFLVVTIALILAAPFAPAITEPITPGRIVANLLLVQGWDLAGSICGPAWSISTECAAYLAFPWIALVLARRPASAIPLALLALALLVFVATRSDNALYEGGSYRSGPLDAFIGFRPYALLRCLAGFTLGILAFRAWRIRPLDALLRRAAVGDALAFVLLVLLWQPGTDVAVVVLFAPFVMTLAHGRSRVARWCATPSVHWLGLVSYSIYLVHEPLQRVLIAPLEQAGNLLGLPHVFTLARFVLLLIVLGVAAATFYGIERPARDHLRNTLPRRSAPVRAVAR